MYNHSRDPFSALRSSFGTNRLAPRTTLFPYTTLFKASKIALTCGLFTNQFAVIQPGYGFCSEGFCGTNSKGSRICILVPPVLLSSLRTPAFSLLSLSASALVNVGSWSKGLVLFVWL